MIHNFELICEKTKQKVKTKVDIYFTEVNEGYLNCILNPRMVAQDVQQSQLHHILDCTHSRTCGVMQTSTELGIVSSNRLALRLFPPVREPPRPQ